jgi:hypothetical protein
MGQSYGPCRIFLPARLLLNLAKYGHILGKTLCSGPRRQPGRQAHGGTGLAPRHHVRCPWDFLGLINTSRTNRVRNNERYLASSPAVSQAFLEGSDLRDQFISFYLEYSYSCLTQGRYARNGDLVTRITVTLSIFNFSSWFFAQIVENRGTKLSCPFLSPGHNFSKKSYNENQIRWKRSRRVAAARGSDAQISGAIQLPTNMFSS